MEKVSAKFVPKLTKNKMGEGGGQVQDGEVQGGETRPGGGRGLTLEVSGGGGDQPDQSVWGGDGGYGHLKTRMKHNSSGTFTEKSTRVQSVRSRIAKIEERHRGGVK